MRKQELFNSQKKIAELEKYCRIFIFDWKKDTKEFMEIKENTKMYYWLYPINFCKTFAFILELLQNNAYEILVDRERAIKRICADVDIEFKYFIENILEIQKLLIDHEKVKVCKDGKIIMMNEYYMK